MEKEKILYFEGAGWSEADTSKETIGNCRVRTAFINNEGEKIYIEITAAPKLDKKHKAIPGKYWMHIDHLFCVTEDADENKTGIKYDYQDLKENYDYREEDITRWINKHLKSNFDTIEVLPDLAGYRVHRGQEYNLVDNFNYDKELTAKRLEIKQHFEELEKSEGKKYPNLSMWADAKDPRKLHLLRHFNGYNKHWEMDPTAENWQKTIKETKLGMYGC